FRRCRRGHAADTRRTGPAERPRSTWRRRETRRTARCGGFCHDLRGADSTARRGADTTRGRPSPGGRTGKTALLLRPHGRGGRPAGRRFAAHRPTALALRSRLAAPRDGVVERLTAVRRPAVRDFCNIFGRFFGGTSHCPVKQHVGSGPAWR